MIIKTITKMFAVVGMFATTIFTSNAQISIGVTGGFATAMDLFNHNSGGKNNVTENGFGGGLTGRYWLKDNMAVGLNMSYFLFDVKDIPKGETATYFNIPISLAFDYYFMDKGLKPFVGLEVGKADVFQNNLVDSNRRLPNYLLSHDEGLFFAPAIGASYRVTDKIDINLNAKYMLGMNGGNQYIIIKVPILNSLYVPTYVSSFVILNLGVSYKFRN